MEELTAVVLNLFSFEILIPWILAMCFGIFVGGTPGLTATMAVALIVPLTYKLSPIAGLAAILGVSFTSIFAGDIPATFLKIPGTPASAAAVLDGYELKKQGKGSLALTIDLFCSAIGGMIGVLILIFFAPPLAEFSLRFTAFEYFWLGLFGLSTSAILTRGNLFRGMISASLGLLVATIGTDVTTGFPRFTFGFQELMGGIEFIPAMIGLFGLSEVFKLFKEKREMSASSLKEEIHLPILKTLKLLIKRPIKVIRAALTGVVTGALPGAGADMGAWIAYGMEKRVSKEPEKFGTGCIDGVIAPTSANNAALGGTWIPALVFGIPGDTITAIVLGAMLMYGLKPGPLIFEENPEIITSVFSIAFISQILLVIIGLIGIKIYGKLLKIPQNIVIVFVLIFSIVGSYAIRSSFFDIYVMLFFGLLGYIFDNLNVPLPPLILGIILGPMVEDNLRTGLIKTGGDLRPFLTRPISFVIFLLLVFLLFGNNIKDFFKKGMGLFQNN